ncbi:MAG: hypothetical protein ACYDAE_17205 [Steroidobacteraceae bacterium]
MNRREPPAIAAWLLSRFAPTRRSESLLGDLFEEYQTGRSPAWYWRETFVALLIAAHRESRELFARRVPQVLLALLAPAALLVWCIALSEQYRQRCPTPSVLPSSALVLATCAGLAAVATALVLWRSSLLRPLRVGRKPGLLRLSVVAFAAIGGFSGAAVTWAGTTSCSTEPLACPSSYETSSCVHRDGNPNGGESVSPNHPNSVLARRTGGVDLRSR